MTIRNTRLGHASLWWFLATASEQFYAPPEKVLPHLPESWSDKPIARAIAAPDVEKHTEVLAEYALLGFGHLMGPLVFAALTDAAWTDLLHLVDTYRRLRRGGGRRRPRPLGAGAMSRTKEADLIAALYLYASRCWAEGDLPALRDIGFGRREMEDLLAVHLVDLQRLSAVHGHPLRVHLDRGAFRLLVEHLRSERDREDTLRELIRRDAPHPMMEALYGMNAREYTGWRLVLEVPPVVGRPPEADEATTHRVWCAWKAMLAGRELDEVRPEEFLALHDETGAPLRSVWPLLLRWRDLGGPAVREGEDDPRKVVPIRRLEGAADA